MFLGEFKSNGENNINISINVYGTKENPYFKAKEIANCLGYSNTTHAINLHVNSEKKINNLMINEVGAEERLPENFDSKTIFIDEIGLSSLISKSKLPAANDFNNWIINIVLPQIKKTNENK